MFRQFFVGRYGTDQLSRAMILFAFILYIPILFLVRGSLASIILYCIAIAMLVLSLLRMFSRQYEARQRENMVFLRVWQKVVGFFSGSVRASRDTWNERRTYKYLTCPQCAQKLRVPRGKGRLRVTCSRCGNRFEAKS